MKKNLLLLGCMLCLMSILTGCKTSAGGSASTNPTNQIISLEIISALENESDVYHINYPLPTRSEAPHYCRGKAAAGLHTGRTPVCSQQSIRHECVC